MSSMRTRTVWTVPPLAGGGKRHALASMLPSVPAPSLAPSLAPLAAALALALLPAPAAAVPKHLQPVPAATLAAMAAADVPADAPILIRAFKRESTMEVWRRARSGRFVLVKAFPICRWSGGLGPKTGKGDRQVPEGFYAVGPGQMNPNSAYYLAFDTGFPNAYDRAHRASGSALMVHGTCSSAGCFAMTDRGIAEIYAMARDAFAGGQRAFQFQSYPFHMTAENLVRYRMDPNVPFWVQLKEGSDRFEATGLEPDAEVAGGRYVFRPYADRSAERAAITRLNAESVSIARLVSAGRAAYRVAYADGGQHPAFAAALAAGTLGDVSRPEALPGAGAETAIPGTAVPQPFRMPAQWAMPPEEPPAALVAAAPGAQDLRNALAMAGLSLPGAPPVPPSGAVAASPAASPADDGGLRMPAPLSPEPSEFSPAGIGGTGPIPSAAPLPGASAALPAGFAPAGAPLAWTRPPASPATPPGRTPVAEAAPEPIRRF